MVVPAGVTLVTLNIDPPVGVSPAGLRIRVDPTWPDVSWSANGQALGTMLESPRRGVVSVKVPAVDQNGFVNSDGQVMKGWQYVLTVEGVVAGASIRTVRLVSPTVAGGALTFGVAIGEGGSASLPAYLSQGALDGRYAPLWQPSTDYAINAPVLLPAPVSAVGKRTAAGTSRAVFDATEQGLWTVAAGSANTWAPSTAYAAGSVVQTPLGILMARKTTGTSSSTWAADRGSWVPGDTTRPWSVRDFGANGDAAESRHANTTTGSNIVTLTSAFNRPFVAGRDEGRLIAVAGAGSGPEGWLTATIASVQSATQATISVNATATVANANAWWGADDTAAINATVNAAKNSSNQSRIVHIPSGLFMITAPVNLPSGVSFHGQGCSSDSRYFGPSAFFAYPTFVGTDMVKMDQIDSGTDYSYHWARFEHIALYGYGRTGPRGLNTGWAGEAMEIANVYIKNCSSGLYMFGSQASFTGRAISVFGCQYGVNCDGVNSTVRFFGLSGDDNQTILRVKGGVSASVAVFSLKAEHYTGTNGDPAIEVVDLDGGSLLIMGGYIETHSARTRVVRCTKTTATTPPRVRIEGLGANNLYTNMVEDNTGAAQVNIPVAQNGTSHPSIFLNTYIHTEGQSARVFGNNQIDQARQNNGVVAPVMGMQSDNRFTFRNPTNSATSSGVAWRSFGGTTVAAADYNIDGAFSVFTKFLSRGATAPTIAAGAGAGSSPTLAVTGNDQAGQATVTPGSSPSAGGICTITFSAAYPFAPKAVMITPTNAATAAALPYVSARSVNSFTVSCVNAPSGALAFDFNIVG